MELSRVIEDASGIAYEEDAMQVVGMIDGEWQIAHSEDMGSQAQMTGQTFDVNSDGVDPGHIERGEITEDWELPEPERE